MKIKFSPYVIKDLEKHKKKDKKFALLLEKQLSNFIANPKLKSLRRHKLSGKLNNMWSISITKKLRLVYLIENNEDILFIGFGSHDEVYGKDKT